MEDQRLDVDRSKATHGEVGVGGGPTAGIGPIPE
jgi:hypothetical protein